MNKILTKNPIWIELKMEVEEYLKNNENNFLEFYNIVRIIFTFVFQIFFYINILNTEDNLYIILNSLGLAFCVTQFGFMTHCATHNSYFKNSIVNKKISILWDIFLGVSAEVWKYKHNALHHTFVNIKDKDEDIDTGSLFIFSPHQNKYWFHKFQWLYVFFLYPLKYVNMLILYNVRFFFMRKRTLLELIGFFLLKMIFLILFIYPVYVKSFELSIIYLMTYVFSIGMYVSFVFAPAHLHENVTMKKEESEHDFFVSQVESTANYSPNIFSNELFFGLNHQIEHHLFPQVHYYYYPKINHIVKKYIKKHNLVYYEYKTIFQAIISHIKFLKKMGKTKETI